ncbi:MAG: hypothetical protein AAF219_02835 [Myxococcota bacterium]
MLGSRTTASIAVLVAGGVSAWVFDLALVAGRLDEFSLFWTGVFAAVAGSAVYRFWGFDEGSGHYYRVATDGALWHDESHFIGSARFRIAIGLSQGDAFDFPGWVHRSIYVAVFFALGLGTLDSRGLELLRRFPERLATVGGRVCDDSSGVRKTKKEEKLGCALVERAFALGYADSLGDCAEEEVEEIELCTLRQPDEPLLHYAWRRLEEFGAAVEQYTEVEQRARMRERFEKRAAHIEPLLEQRRDVLATAPRASHHIFTNLPHPRGRFGENRDVLGGSLSCVDRYRRLPHRPPTGKEGSANPSQVFEHIVAQLLFETRYTDAGGYCPEYTIHWEVSADACPDLANDPARFLEQAGARAQVQRVLDRYERERTLAVMRGDQTQSEIDLTRIVSFQCYIEGDRVGAAREDLEAQLRRTRFPVTDVRVPALNEGYVPADRYGYVAGMLVPDFQYGRLFSQALTSSKEDDARIAQFFEYRRGYLSRLDQLASVDLFLGDSWVLDRADLLEIYPYHVHMRNYVELFRSRYQVLRGRL